jgi:WhiB family transcriptional regulator, redox-sensing transcriptional regulator
MATAAAPDPPTNVSLLDLALEAGVAFSDERWRTTAACTGIDPQVFLPEPGTSLEEALRYCRRCPVRAECLQAAFDLGPKAIGVWGSTSAQERRVARRHRLTATELLAELDRR